MRKVLKIKSLVFLILSAFTFNVITPYSALAHNEPWYLNQQTIPGETNVTSDLKDTQAKQEPANGCTPQTSEPVFLFNGEETYECTDLVIPGRG